MVGRRPRISDTVCRLGLLAPYTKQRQDWALNPTVQEFYNSAIEPLSRSFADKSNDDIRVSYELRTASLELLSKYGSEIWPADPEGAGRPWLFKANDHRSREFYTRPLHYDNDGDRQVRVSRPSHPHSCIATTNLAACMYLRYMLLA